VDGSRRQGPRRHRVSGQCLKQAEFSGEIPMKKQTKRVVPAFPTEAEEAQWYKNRKIHDRQLLAAVKSGEAQLRC